VAAVPRRSVSFPYTAPVAAALFFSFWAPPEVRYGAPVHNGSRGGTRAPYPYAPAPRTSLPYRRARLTRCRLRAAYLLLRAVLGSALCSSHMV
jgi:hypothetical protein